MTTKRPDRTRAFVVAVVLIAIVVVVGAGVYRNDLNYTTTAGGLFVIVGYLLRGKSSDEDDE